MPAFNWFIPAAADAVIGSGTVADDWLAGFNTHVTGNSGNASAKWEVAGYSSSSPKSLILKRKAGGAGRIIFFGQNGGTPNAAAVRSATASLLYVGYSATSTADTPDASFLTGAPLSAGDYMLGVCALPNAAATYRLTSAEFDDGFCFLVSNTSSGLGACGAGDLVKTNAGSFLPTIFGTGSSGLSTNWATSVSAGAAQFNPNVGTNSVVNSGAVMNCRMSGANHTVYRLFLIGNSANHPLMQNASANTVYYFPIFIVGNSDNPTQAVVGKLRQIAFGPPCVRETTLYESSVATAYGHGSQTSAPTVPPMWFINEEI